jgi:hypothetical protein
MLMLLPLGLMLFAAGCPAKTVYLPESNKPYFLPNGDACMSKGVYADLLQAADRH